MGLIQRGSFLRGAVVVLLAALLLFSYWSGWIQELSLANLKLRQAEIQAFYLEHPVRTALIYLLLYTVISGLGIPGPTILSLGAGAIFGLWVGTLIISVASALGATISFLLARLLFAEWVGRRARHLVVRIREGYLHGGLSYFLSVRLTPVFPFLLVNSLMALTPIRVWEFYWISQIGMIPLTFLYVNAGTQLGSIHHPQDVLTPRVVVSLVALALFPLAVNRFFRRRGSRSASPV